MTSHAGQSGAVCRGPSACPAGGGTRPGRSGLGARARAGNHALLEPAHKLAVLLGGAALRQRGYRWAAEARWEARTLLDARAVLRPASTGLHAMCAAPAPPRQLPCGLPVARPPAWPPSAPSRAGTRWPDAGPWRCSSEKGGAAGQYRHVQYSSCSSKDEGQQVGLTPARH